MKNKNVMGLKQTKKEKPAKSSNQPFFQII